MRPIGVQLAWIGSGDDIIKIPFVSFVARF